MDNASEKKRVINMLQYVESQIEQGMKIGANFDEALELLAGAKMMLEVSMLDQAEEVINQASEVAGKIISKFNILMNSLRKARKNIQDIEAAGGNSEEAREMLEKAERAMKIGNYEMAINFTNKSIQSTGQTRSSLVPSWYVEPD